jgi:phage tail-like protein
MDIIIELFNEKRCAVCAWNVCRCRPSEFQAGPELDVSGTAIAVESVVLQNESWES